MSKTAVALSFALGALAATLFLHYRVQWLHALNLRLTPPPVPVSVTERIREAEAQFYDQRGVLRRAAEEGQDILTFVAPLLSYRMNFSLGPYRIKASTIEELLPWAEAQGYLTLGTVQPAHGLRAIAYFAEQPAAAEWGAAVVLESLRQRHPDLRGMDWPTIAADPALIAKLYSGYMGAGGDWEAWEATLTPGPEALRRLGLTEETRP